MFSGTAIEVLLYTCKCTCLFMCISHAYMLPATAADLPSQNTLASRLCSDKLAAVLENAAVLNPQVPCMGFLNNPLLGF